MNLELHKPHKARSLYPCVSGIYSVCSSFAGAPFRGRSPTEKRFQQLGENRQSRQLSFHSLYNRTMQGRQMLLFLYFLCQYCSTVALSTGFNETEYQRGPNIRRFTCANLLSLMGPWMTSIHASMPLSCRKV